MMGMLLWSMLSLSPHSDGDATLVNAVFESSQWCACPLVNALLSPHSDGLLLWSMLSLSPHTGVHDPWSMLS